LLITLNVGEQLTDIVLYCINCAVNGILTLCPKKNIPNIFDCNVKKDYRILIIFGTNISETTCRQVTI